MDHIEVLRKAVERIKFRIHFIGGPSESYWNAGSDERPHWIPDWRYEIALIEHALHGAPIDALEKPSDTKPYHAITALSAKPEGESVTRCSGYCPECGHHSSAAANLRPSRSRGVVVDEAMVRRALRAFEETPADYASEFWELDLMRAALVAALGEGEK